MSDEIFKTQRVRDPIHDLIVFDKDDSFDQLIWRLLNASEFQRLRRIRQLGFSEFVFPGATHTRFMHSIGVFHTARALLGILKKRLGNDFDLQSANVAVCAALLHDVGHGPFSHTFEGVQKKRGFKKKHEEWTANIVRGEVEGPDGKTEPSSTEINKILSEFDKANGTTLVQDVGGLLVAKDPKDIYASIVSSQFDADRMDYLRRDRYMTGTETGRFDYNWLMDNIDVAKIYVSFGDEDDVSEQDGLILSEKGLQAAEGYLLSRYHLYQQVYMHKTTRGAEMMLGALLHRISMKLREDKINLRLNKNHDLVRFLNNGHNVLSNYLALDDTIIWAALPHLASSEDKIICDLASRLRERRLFKCFDAGQKAGRDGAQKLMRFRHSLQRELDLETEALIDRANITAYGVHVFDEPGALQKVLIRRYKGDMEPVDIVQCSKILEAIGEQELFRVYASTPEVFEKILELWEGDANG